MRNTTTIYRQIEVEASPDVWEEVEVEIEVDYIATPRVRGARTLRNGDPGYPDEGGDVDVLSAVRTDTGEAVELTDAEVSAIEEGVEWEDDDGDYEEDDDYGDDDEDYDADPPEPDYGD